MKKIAFIAVFIFLLLPGPAQAGNILFEMPFIYGLANITWGQSSSSDGLKIAEFMFPHASQVSLGVCEVGLWLAQSGGPTDNVVLKLYRQQLATNDPESGVLLAQGSVSGQSLPASIGNKTIFQLDNCLDVDFDTWFVISRSNPNSQGEYLAQIAPLNIFSNFWFAHLDQNLVWQKNDFKELRFSLETGSPAPLKEPIIIIPGIMGSYLNRVDNQQEVWPNAVALALSREDGHLDILGLDKFGAEIPGNELRPGGIVETASPITVNPFGFFSVYEDLVNNFENLGYIKDEDLIIFSYDWRQNITSTSLELKDIINNKADVSPTGKVTIITHSMGSLVTKEYLESNQNSLPKLDKIIFLGSPQLGAPRTFNILNFGEDVGVIGLNPNKAKEIAQNMPAIYQLLPSREYLNTAGSYIEDKRSSGLGNLSYDQTRDFMLFDNYLNKGFSNQTLLDNADTFHQNLDNLMVSGPEVHNIIGCSEKTLTGMELYDNKKIDIKLDKGDGTVPLKSARRGFATGQVNYYAKDFNHFDLVSDDEVLSLIDSIISGGSFSSNKIGSSDLICDTGKLRFLFSTHSPVNLRVYDHQNNYIGLDTNGDVNLGISNSDFMQIGENNFALVPEGTNYRVEISAYDIGSFDFKIRSLGDSNKDSALYLNLPINNPNLKAQLLFDGNLNVLELKIDEDGNGSFDKTLKPHIIELESTQITTGIIISNIEGLYNLGWIKSKKIKESLILTLKLYDKAVTQKYKDLLIKVFLKELEIGKRLQLINSEAYDIIRGNIKILLNG